MHKIFSNYALVLLVIVLWNVFILKSVHCFIIITVLLVKKPFFLDCYSPSLIPLKPFSRYEDVVASVEVQTFCPQKTETAVPFNEYINNFYIYPISLNYNVQKTLKVHYNYYFFNKNVTIPSIFLWKWKILFLFIKSTWLSLVYSCLSLSWLTPQMS